MTNKSLLRILDIGVYLILLFVLISGGITWVNWQYWVIGILVGILQVIYRKRGDFE